MCRESSEVYPLLGSGDLNTTSNHTVPEDRLDDVSGGGCFGTGPGIFLLTITKYFTINMKHIEIQRTLLGNIPYFLYPLKKGVQML